MVSDIAGGLRNLEGMSAGAVRKVLETVRATFEDLADAAPDDPELQRSRGRMLTEFGRTYHTLGNLGAALEAYREQLGHRGAPRSRRSPRRGLAT